MAREPLPLFLERSNYRRRRVLDAVKLVVILGVLLWSMPVLWPTSAEDEAVPMSRALYYVFGVWILLIVLSAVLVGKLRRTQDTESDTDETP